MPRFEITPSLLLKWQPNIAYTAETSAVTPLIDKGMYYVCCKSGVSGSVEPEWLNSGSVNDGEVQWLPRQRYYVTLGDVKGFLRVSSEVDDQILIVLIQAATSRIEEYLNIDIVQKKVYMYLDMPVSCSSKDEITIPVERYPVVSVDTVELKEEGATVWDIIDINTNIYKSPWEYPVIEMGGMNYIGHIRLLLTVGVTESDGFGKVLKLAIMMYVAWLYENRGDVDNYVPLSLPSDIRQVLPAPLMTVF